MCYFRPFTNEKYFAQTLIHPYTIFLCSNITNGPVLDMLTDNAAKWAKIKRVRGKYFSVNIILHYHWMKNTVSAKLKHC